MRFAQHRDATPPWLAEPLERQHRLLLQTWSAPPQQPALLEHDVLVSTEVVQHRLLLPHVPPQHWEFDVQAALNPLGMHWHVPVWEKQMPEQQSALVAHATLVPLQHTPPVQTPPQHCVPDEQSAPLARH
jgi:hypothetical protein